MWKERNSSSLPFEAGLKKENGLIKINLGVRETNNRGMFLKEDTQSTLACELLCIKDVLLSLNLLPASCCQFCSLLGLASLPFASPVACLLPKSHSFPFSVFSSINHLQLPCIYSQAFVSTCTEYSNRTSPEEKEKEKRHMFLNGALPMCLSPVCFAETNVCEQGSALPAALHTLGRDAEENEGIRWRVCLNPCAFRNSFVLF